MVLLKPLKFCFMVLAAGSVALIAVPSFTKPMMERFMPRRASRQMVNQNQPNQNQTIDQNLQRLERRCEESRINLFLLPWISGDPYESTAECRDYQSALRPQEQQNRAQNLAPRSANRLPYNPQSFAPSAQTPRDRPIAAQSMTPGRPMTSGRSITQGRSSPERRRLRRRRSMRPFPGASQTRPPANQQPGYTTTPTYSPPPPIYNPTR
jgi:hypothetical protein